MTADQLWRAVGETLLVQRTRRGWKPIHVEQHGGPTYKTVQEIEQGKVGNADKLEQYAKALGLNVVDILRTVLLEHQRPVTPETLQLVRKFERTTFEGRQALLLTARALPDAEEAHEEPHGSPSGPRAPAPRKR